MVVSTADIQRLQFDEANEYLRQKIRLPSASWSDIWQQQHSRAFVVAGAANDALVEDLYNALMRSQLDGTGSGAFRSEFVRIADAHTWDYRGSAGWRSEVLYRTNIRQAHNAGMWQQQQDAKKQRPYLQYHHSHRSKHPRAAHLAWDGMVLAVDDPWWQTHYPQNGWGCRCYVTSLNQDDMDKLGKTKPDTAPPIDWHDVRIGGANPRVVRTPHGVSAGFGYNPGIAWEMPHTIPPLLGYQAVLAQRGIRADTLDIPAPANPATYTQPPTWLANASDEDAVQYFLQQFAADLQQAKVFQDVTGTPLVISKALFTRADGKWKWENDGNKKSYRLNDVHNMPLVIAEPDEVWWHWEQSYANQQQWRLKRRYLKTFIDEQTQQPMVAAFEWSKTGWVGSTVFTAKTVGYLNKQRVGKLIWKK